MRTFVIVALTVIATAATIGIGARFVRERQAEAAAQQHVEPDLRSLRAEVQELTRLTEAIASRIVPIRSEVASLANARTSLIRDNNHDLLRTLGEFRDYERMPEVSAHIARACEKSARQNGIDMGRTYNSVRVFIDAQSRLFEIRRRLVPPDQMLSSVGWWTPRLLSEVQGLRSWRHERLMDNGLNDREVRILVDAVSVFQDLTWGH